MQWPYIHYHSQQLTSWRYVYLVELQHAYGKIYVISTEPEKSLPTELSNRINSPIKTKNMTWTPEAPICPAHHCPSPKVTTSPTSITTDEFCLVLNLTGVQSCIMKFCHVAEGSNSLFVLIANYSTAYYCPVQGHLDLICFKMLAFSFSFPLSS